MITRRVKFGLVAVVMTVVGATACTSRAVHAGIFHTTAASPTVSDPSDLLPDVTEPHLDVYGNEIEDAVTDYRIDTGGDVYERHSPDTEVPRLGPPIG